MNNKISIKDLAESHLHFGHKTSRRHPDMSPYIWGKKNGVHLVDLSKSQFLLEYACQQLEDIMAEGGQSLWVGTKKQAKDAVKSVGEELEHPHVYHRWIGGTITNHEHVRKAVTRLLHMRDVISKPMEHRKKKEVVMLKKEAERLEKNVSGIIKLKGRPAVMIVMDAKREQTAIKEANRWGVPVIALVDTNTSTSMVDTVIPGNDDSPKAIGLVLDLLKEAAQRGVAKAKEAQEKKAKEAKAELEAKKKASKPALAAKKEAVKKPVAPKKVATDKPKAPAAEKKVEKAKATPAPAEDKAAKKAEPKKKTVPMKKTATKGAAEKKPATKKSTSASATKSKTATKAKKAENATSEKK